MYKIIAALIVVMCVYYAAVGVTAATQLKAAIASHNAAIEKAINEAEGK